MNYGFLILLAIMLYCRVYEMRKIMKYAIMLSEWLIYIWTGETAKWEKITYAGIVSCTILAVVSLSKGHPHHEEPPVIFIFPLENFF